jgi:multidrug efflux pump subunit AcrA (membrane-fusion protein)
MGESAPRSGKRIFRAPAAIIGFLLLLSLPFVLPKLDRRGSSSISADGGSSTPDGAPSVEVNRGELKRTLLLDGELRAVNSRAVFATTNEEAKITYLPPEGTVVKAGDRVVEMDSGTVLGRIKDAEEKIVAAENEIVKARSTGEAALRDLEVELSKRWLALEQAKVNARAPASVIPRRDYQENQLNLEKARTEYDNQLNKIENKKKELDAELQVKTIQLNKLKVQLDRANASVAGMNIKAPADGMVIYSDHWFERRKIQIGDVVWGGFPIIRLPDLTAMEAIAQVNEVDGPKLSVAQRATMRLDSYPDIEITGSVKEIAETAVKASWMAKAKVFRVVISLDKTVGEIMKPGMSGQIAVSMPFREPSLLVPRSGVVFDASGASVIRVEGESRRPVVVTVLSGDAIHYAVADNGALKEGDRIIVRPNQ